MYHMFICTTCSYVAHVHMYHMFICSTCSYIAHVHYSSSFDEQIHGFHFLSIETDAETNVDIWPLEHDTVFEYMPRSATAEPYFSFHFLRNSCTDSMIAI